MSDEDVEFVRRSFEVVASAFNACTTFHGHEGVARGWDDFLTWADHYRPSLRDAEDLGFNRVFVEVSFAGEAKDGPPMSGTFFAVFTVRDGRVLRVDEYTTRLEALEALGQPQG